jgi:hypothetical protein
MIRCPDTSCTAFTLFQSRCLRPCLTNFHLQFLFLLIRLCSRRRVALLSRKRRRASKSHQSRRTNSFRRSSSLIHIYIKCTCFISNTWLHTHTKRLSQFSNKSLSLVYSIRIRLVNSFHCCLAQATFILKRLFF